MVAGPPQMPAFSASPPIERLDVSAFTVPTDSPESDGTLKWDRTTMVLVQVHGGGHRGLGYTYAGASTAKLIHSVFSEVVQGSDSMAVTNTYLEMWKRIRNLGRPGICSTAISAVDCALWDLKARLLNLPLARLLGQVRPGAPVYG